MEFFGPLDELDMAQQLTEDLHVALNAEESLKTGDGNNGKCTIVAPKGFGKTHIRRYIEEKAKNNFLIASFNESGYVFDEGVAEYKYKSGRFKSLISYYLLVKVAEIVAKSDAGRWSSFEHYLGKLAKTAKSVASATSRIEFSVGAAKVSLGNIFSSTSGISQATIQPLVDSFVQSLGNQRLIVTIDDIEEVFPGIENNPSLIEGLVRSCAELNRQFGSKVHFLIFMKYGLWRILSENRTEYDKIKNQFAFLNWNEFLFKQLIARRLGVFRVSDQIPDIDFNDEDQLYQRWSKYFNFGDKTSWSNRVKELSSYCRSGARDLIYLCNYADEISQADRISWSDIEKSRKHFSSEKLKDICAEHSDEYPDIELFVKAALDGATSTPSYEQLTDRVQAIVGDNFVADTLRKHDWFQLSNTADKVKTLFEIGIIGVLQGRAVRYSYEGHEVNASELTTAPISIHPAFENVLVS